MDYKELYELTKAKRTLAKHKLDITSVNAEIEKVKVKKDGNNKDK